MILKLFFKKFTNIVPTEETYFVVVNKPENINLSKEAIYLNYKNLSPFPNGDLVYLQTKDNIYIWFTKNKLLEKNKIYIPEGYLIYKNLKEKNETIGITEKYKNIVVLSVIKNKHLLSQIIVKKDSLNQKILFLAKEYSLKKPEKLNIPLSKLKVSLLDIFLFSKFSIQKENLYKTIIETVSLPISILLISLTIFYLLIDKYLEKQIKEKTIYLNSLKKKTKDIKDLLYSVEEKKQFWENFIKTENRYPFVYYVLNEIMKVVKKKEGYINRIEFNQNNINIWAGLKEGDTSIVNDLLKTGIFKEVRIISSVKDSQKKGYDITNIEIYLKETK